MVVEFQLGMAVVGDNRGGNDRPVAQRPDGSWSFEDARRRRDQREAEQTAPAPPTPGEPQEDLSALALSLADNLTIDGTPLSQLETQQAPDRSAALGHAARDAPTAEDIMRALETEQHAGPPTSTNGAQGAHRGHPPHQPSARKLPHRSRPRIRPWVTAWTLAAAVAALLAVEFDLGAGTTPRRQPSRSTASRTATPTAALVAAATEEFLATEHAADRNLATARPPSTHTRRPTRHQHTPARSPARPPSGSRSSSTTTSSTSGISEAGRAQQASPSSSGPSSSSTSSGSGQPATPAQPHTEPTSNSGSSSSTPSKAALKSLVTGAGTCSCQ